MTMQTGSIYRGCRLFSAVLLPGALVLAGPAFAEGAGSPGAGGTREDEIPTVLVTANKRIENVQKVPIAITAITADTASSIGVVNGQTLAQSIPGLTINRQTNGVTPFLRGVGNPSTQAGTEPAVALYVDDVYYGGANVGLTNYNSIDRIDVLKGPQGTLFGRNATGGVIQVFTKDPSPEPHLDLSFGYANYDTPSGSLYATGRLAETLGANFAAYAEKQNNGYGTNFTTGNPTYLTHDYGGRAKLLWRPSDKASVLFNADYDDYYSEQAVYFRPAPGTTSNAGVSSVPPPNVYDTFENLDPQARVKQYGGSAKVKFDFGPMNLVSISAYRHFKAIQQFDQDGSSLFRLDPLLVYTGKTWTQEFQLLSPADARVAWVAGFYYLNDTTVVDPFYFNGVLAGGRLAYRGANATQDTKSYSGFFQTTAPITSASHVTAGGRITSDARSVAGGRINQSATGVRSAFVPATNSGLSKRWSQVTWRLAFDYEFTDDLMGYVAWNRGFKSGVFNTILAPDFVHATPFSPTFDAPASPEKLSAYTVGVKSEFLNRRLRVNAEGFYYKYKNLQLQQVVLIPGGGTTTSITNAAEATMKGIDIDVTAIPVSNLTLSAAIEIMDGKYDSYPDGQFFSYRAVPGGNCAFSVGNTGRCAALPPNYDPATGHWNLAGNKTVQTPPFSTNLTAAYDIPVGLGLVNLTVNWSHTGNYYADPDNGLGQIAPSSRDNDRQRILNIVNASVAWRSANDRWNLRVWGKNLSDERYWSFANETGTVTKNVPAPPRTYGVTFMAHF